MRGFHRPQSRRFKESVLARVDQVDVHSEAGVYLRTVPVMFAEPERIHRVVNRFVRGLYSHLTARILPSDWPVSSELVDPLHDGRAALEALFARREIRFWSIGNDTFLYAWKQLEGEERQNFFWLVFYKTTHFWGFTGTRQWEWRRWLFG